MQAKLIYKASRKVFPAAFETLDWLTKLGKQAHKEGADCLRWNTPTGDTVHLVEYRVRYDKGTNSLQWHRVVRTMEHWQARQMNN